ncbi:MAG: hypothetical protein KC731_19855, partial [Myxococcales bacterium]|nr:hypothetical protein [Myxococcales bacterium]
ASIILGLDGNIDLGGLLSGFSPGTKGAFNFLFAAGGDSLRTDGSGHHWGDLNPVNQGISLGFYGGTEPTPVSSCVVPANIELPTGIPIPDELTQNSLPNWPDPNGPHFGFALSERFLNYMFAQLYNSGALCLGITADALGGAVPLNTQLIGVGLGAPSLSELGRQKLGAELAIILRPGAPPTVEVGNGTDLATDPLLRIRMNQVAFDFYVFSLDRFVRAFTATMDLEVPMNLMVSEEGLTPVIEELGVNNAVVTNSELIREDADKIATTLQDLLGGLVGSALGGALPAINLNDQLASLGLTLTIPPTMDGAGSPGLRKLTKGDDDFLGIFATLGIAMPQMAMAAPPAPQTRVHTEVEVDSFEVDPEGLRVATWTEDNGPKLRLRVGADLDDGAHALEWQYRVDGMPWHPFRRDRVIDVNDPWIRTMGKHTVQVRARVVGDPLSLDREPAEVTVIVDDEAPKVKLVRTAEGAVEVKVSDLVSAAEDIVVRVRWANDDDGELVWTEWSAWTPSTELAALPADVDAIEVEAMDEDGRVGTAQSELIRGVGDGGAGCQCSLDRQPGESAPRGFWLAGLLGLA